MVRKISNLPNSNSSLLDYWHLFYCGQEFSIEFENENNKNPFEKRKSQKEQDLNLFNQTSKFFIIIHH